MGSQPTLENSTQVANGRTPADSTVLLGELRHRLRYTKRVRPQKESSLRPVGAQHETQSNGGANRRERELPGLPCFKLPCFKFLGTLDA